MSENSEDKPGSPLYPILNEINMAAKSGLPFLAVAMCVALPDICVSLASPNGRTDWNGKKSSENYKAWCKDNLNGSDFSYLTPDDLYSMRCGVLHNGRFGDMKHSAERVIFALPGQTTIINGHINGAYVYSVAPFCLAFTRAVYRWFEANRNNPHVQANLPRLMQYRFGGFAPYIEGITVLA